MDQAPAAGFIHWKYKGGAPLPPGPVRRALFYATLVLALAVSFLAFPGGLLAFAIPLLIRFAVPRQLSLGPRYLLCGSDIVYFGNIDRVVLDETRGRMTLQAGERPCFVLERDKFPTNARKTAKVAANQAAKFAKVSAKLLERIRQASPAVEVTGA